MSKSSCVGVHAPSGGRALLAILVLGTLPAGQTAFAESRPITFSGELNYATFRSAAARGDTVTIKSSPGGTGAAALALARVSKVVIDGRCNSACAWAFVRNANACFTPRASFGFHAAHDPGTGRRLNAATSYWLQNVRPSLRGKLRGLLSTSSLINVSAAEMRRYYGDRVCGSGGRTQVAKLQAPKRKPAPQVAARTATAKGGAKARSATRTAAKAPSTVVHVVEVGASWTVSFPLWTEQERLALGAVTALAAAMLEDRRDVGVALSDPAGALPVLLGLPRLADVATAWEAQGTALFATAGAGAAIATARAKEEPAERPIGSLTLLYLSGMPVG